jgi:uncharacterized protein (DUF1800 family)
MHLIGKTWLHVLIVISMTTSSLSAGNFDVDSREEGFLLKRKIRAAQFLHFATFGPSMSDVDALAGQMVQVGGKKAMTNWIDAEFAKPPTLHQPLTETMITGDGFTTITQDIYLQRYRHHAWWEIAINGDDQLRQRMAWALSQIVVTNGDIDDLNDTQNLGNISQKGRWLGASNYYDMLVRNSFGNYRTLLTDATYHPAMGSFLSHLRNRKSDGTRFPDENYAREVMQLFTIGLYDLQRDGRLKTSITGEFIPTYDNDDIRELARVFTGLTFAPNPATTSNPFYSGNDYLVPMVMHQPEHDTQPKTLLNNTVINQVEGNAEISAALDSLFNHDNIAPFISYRLIQRFTKSNPSRGYILRVARKFENNGQGVRGDMKAVIKAILLDPEPYQSLRIGSIRDAEGDGETVVCKARGTEYSHLREPVIQYASMFRGCNATSDHPSGQARLMPLNYLWDQEPYRQPTVFNFYLPNYQPPGDLITYPASLRVPNGNLVAPEFQIKNAVTSNRTMNHIIANSNDLFHRVTAGSTTGAYYLNFKMNFNLQEELALAAQENTLIEVVDRFDLLFCCGTMPQDYKEEMVRVINDETRWMPGNAQYASQYTQFRVSCALMTTLTSPFAAIGE